MKRSGKKWILTALRYGLCFVALALLVSVVRWYDVVRLDDAELTELRLLEERGDTLLVLRDGEEVEIRRADVHKLEDGVLDIEPGIRGVVRRMDGKWAFWALLVFTPVPFLQALRLVWMLGIQGVRLSLWNAIKLSFAGNFFNFALPGATGGDVIKAYYLTRYTQRKTEAVLTVFLDRVVGLFGLVLLAGTMILVTWDRERYGQFALVLSVVCGCLAVGALLVFSRRLRHAIKLPELAERLPMGDQLLRIGRATVAMRQHKGMVALSLWNTLALQITVIFSAFLMARALGLGGDVGHYFVYVPIGFLIAAVPISPPQGIGVVELFYIQFFAHTGLSTESQAVAFALGVRFVQLAWALPGVLVPLLGAHLPSQADLENLDEPAAVGVAAAK